MPTSPLTDDSRRGPDSCGWSPERMLARLAGDRDLARQLAGIFIGECPRMLAAIQEGIDQGSADAVRRAAHALKGSVLNFVDDGPAATAYALEQMGREGRIDGAGAALTRLESELAELIERLRGFQEDTCGS